MQKTPESIVDLRSDTVTQPVSAMREAMFNAPLGDDVFGDDPSVNALQDKIAALLGFEAALFMPTGTQSNLCGILAHCQRGDEYIVGQMAHCYRWEGGGAAVLGSVQPQPIAHQADGTLALADIEAAIKPDDPHFARTRLLALENTLGGQLLPFDYVDQATALATRHGLARHLDGARLFNAAVAQAEQSPLFMRGGTGHAAGPSQGGAAPSGGSEPHEVGSVGALQAAAPGRSQARPTPSGGREPHAVGERGGMGHAAGPSQGGAAPSGGREPHAVGERGGMGHAAGPSQARPTPSGGREPHAVGERGGIFFQARRIAQCFDSASICFSKGLGAPAGSALCGSGEFIARARRLRKMAGGAMRQAGLLAAAASWALDHHVERLAQDHALARRLAEGLAGIDGLQVEPPHSNILFVGLTGPAAAHSAGLLPHLAAHGVLATGLYRLRLVTHLGVDADGIDRTIGLIHDYFAGKA